MSKAKNITIFLLIPLAVILLLYLNARIMSQQYGSDQVDWDQYKAELSTDFRNLSFKAGDNRELLIQIENEGTMTWISEGESPIFLSYRIKNDPEGDYIREGDRFYFLEAVRPGEQTELAVKIEAPLNPGQYFAVIDLVHEGVAWFEDRGSEPLVIELEVN